MQTASQYLAMQMTLREVLHTCDDWRGFCDDFGFSPYAVAEGGGDIQVTLDLDEAKQHGIISIENVKGPLIRLNT